MFSGRMATSCFWASQDVISHAHDPPAFLYAEVWNENHICYRVAPFWPWGSFYYRRNQGTAATGTRGPGGSSLALGEGDARRRRGALAPDSGPTSVII